MTVEIGWSTPAYEAIARLVESRTGLLFTPGIRRTVESRIKAAMVGRSSGKPADYLELVSTDFSEFGALVDAVTVGETYFFREPAQLDHIRTGILPELARRSPRRPVRAWSAGCATGEEAYTLAILLSEAGLGGDATVLATDISPARLERARRALFSRWSLRGVSELTVQRYFQRQGTGFHLRPEVRTGVTFRPLNLLEGGFGSPGGILGMDLVLCRNVLIYLNPEVVPEIARRLIAALSEDGWLILGASDPPLADLVSCEVVVTGGGVAYRRRKRGRTWSSPVAATPAPLPPAVPAPELGQRAIPAPEGTAPRPAPEAPGPEASLETVQSSFAARDYARAAQVAAHALEISPADPRLWGLRIRALAKQGKVEEAGRACLAALEIHRTSAELMCLHAVLLSMAGHWSEAAASARRALYLDRELIMAHVVLGHALLRSGDRPKARRTLQTAERLILPLPPETILPASDDEPAARLLEIVRRHLKLLAAA